MRKIIQLVITYLGMITLLCSCTSDHTKSSWAKEFGYDTSEVFSIKVGKFGFPFIEGKINDSRISMLFDTGNLVGVSISPFIADKLKLKTIGDWTENDSAGNPVAALKCYSYKTMTVLNHKITTRKLFELNDSDFEGAIGVDWLLDKRFTLDYKKQFIGISKKGFTEKMEEVMIPIVWSEDFCGMLVVNGTINGQEALIQLDTGKSRTCIDESIVSKLGLSYTNTGCEINEIALGSYKFSVKNAKIVSFKGINKGYSGPILLGIGSDLLSNVVLSVDLPNRNIILTGNPQ